MRKIIFSFVFLLSTNLLADDQIEIRSLDPGIDLSQIEDRKEIKKVVGFPEFKKSQNPTVKDVDHAIEISGLKEDTSKFDQLDKDRLYLKAQKYPIKRLVKDYPNLNPKKLEQLKEIVQ